MEEESKLSQQYLPPLPTTLNDDVSSFNSLLHVNNWFINPSSINQNQNFMFQSFNPFTNDFDFGSEPPGLLNSNPSLFHLSSNPEFVPTRAVELSEGGFHHNTMCGVGEQCHASVASNSLFFNQGSVFQHQGTKVLAPAVVLPQMMTAFSQGPVDRLGALEVRTAARLGTMERKRKVGLNDDSHDDDVEIDKYEENVNNGGNNFEGNNVNNDDDDDDDDDDNGGMRKGKTKKKIATAKNLMAERRRRKRLNDRLYMLRSVVPKISKMDRASILGDAIEYLKDLIQKVNDLHNELGSTPFGSNPTPSSSFHPVTPSLPTLPFRVKDELCLSSLTTPKNQSPKVEVRLREGKAIDVHMLCACKPGLFLSTMRALDSLGFDVQQAVISGFNDFVLDVYRAEQCRGLDLLPEQIKTLLLQAADFNGGTM